MTNKSIEITGCISFFSLLIYILFQYIAQDEFMPHSVHSITMYAFILFSFIYSLIGRKRFPSFTIWFGIFLIYSCCSASLAIHTDFDTLYQVFVCWVISYCVAINLDSYQKIVYLSKTYSFSSVILGLMILIKTGIAGLVAMGNSSGVERLGTDLMGNANIFTAMYMYAAIFTIWLLVYSNNKIEKILYISVLSFQLFLMSLSGGRKTIVVVLLCFLFSQYLKNGSRQLIKNMKAFLTTIILFIIVFYAIMNIDFLYNAIGSRFEGLLDVISGKSSSVHSDNERMQMIQLGLDYWTENPLFGHGLDSFKYVNHFNGGGFKYSHNNYVELLFDFGLIGFILFYSIYVIILRRLLHKPKSEIGALVYMILLELIVFDLGGISYYTSGNIMLLAIAFSSCNVININNIKTAK